MSRTATIRPTDARQHFTRKPYRQWNYRGFGQEPTVIGNYINASAIIKRMSVSYLEK